MLTKPFLIAAITFWITGCGSSEILKRQQIAAPNQQDPSGDLDQTQQQNEDESQPSEDVILEETSGEENLEEAPETAPLTEEEIIALGLQQMDEEKAKETLKFVTADEHLGRLSGTTGNEDVADYLIKELEALNIQPAQEGGYRQDFSMRNGPTRGKITSNIIAMLPGQDEKLKDEYVVIGAHMDHAGSLSYGYTCSKGSQDSNQICNGADDNASGTTGILNIAKALSAVREHLKRTVIIMWFSGEEEGLEGSWHYVRNPIFPLAKTVFMMNLDMIGYAHTNSNRVSALGGGTSSFGESVIKSLDEKYPVLKVDITAKAGGGSDHVPFMAEGIPGVFFNTGVSNNPNYHKTSDTADKIYFEGLMEVAKMGFELIYRVAGSDEVGVQVNFAGEPTIRSPLVTKEEEKQSCHHLIKNPYLEKLSHMMQGNP